VAEVTGDPLREVTGARSGVNPDIVAMVELLDGSLVGMPLVKELKARFPHAKRDDVYLAIGMAMTLKEADLMVYEGLARFTETERLA
jgi:hypothetical protein